MILTVSILINFWMTVHSLN